MSKDHSSLPHWKTTSERQLVHTKIFDLDAVTRTEEGTHREGEFFVLKAQDWINVIAITSDSHLVFVEQYRHGTNEFELEIVGGMVDGEESPLVAALRELKEETGYEPTANSIIEQIGDVTPNPAFLNNHCYTFLVTNAERSSGQTFDEHENIHVRLEPLSNMDELVRSGEITHSLVIAAFYYYHQWKSNRVS